MEERETETETQKRENEEGIVETHSLPPAVDAPIYRKSLTTIPGKDDGNILKNKASNKCRRHKTPCTSAESPNRQLAGSMCGVEGKQPQGLLLPSDRLPGPQSWRCLDSSLRRAAEAKGGGMLGLADWRE